MAKHSLTEWFPKKPLKFKSNFKTLNEYVNFFTKEGVNWWESAASSLKGPLLIEKMIVFNCEKIRKWWNDAKREANIFRQAQQAGDAALEQSN